MQHALPRLLATSAAIQAQLRSRILANLRCVRATAGQDGSPISVLNVEAGWYALLRVPRIMTDECWAATLVEKEAVVVHPGSFFGFDEDGYLVVSLIVREPEFADAMQRLANRVRRECDEP